MVQRENATIIQVADQSGDTLVPIDDVVPAARPTPLRVATWNMNHWQRTLEQRTNGWASVVGGLGVDVALLQETVPPPGFDRERVLYREIADYRPWGSAITSTTTDRVVIEELSAVKVPGSHRRFRLSNTFPGSVVVARLNIDGVQPITAVSLYVVNDGYA